MAKLSTLRHGEICTLLLEDGTNCEAAWCAFDRCFYSFQGKMFNDKIHLGDVVEWIAGKILT